LVEQMFSITVEPGAVILWYQHERPSVLASWVGFVQLTILHRAGAVSASGAGAVSAFLIDWGLSFFLMFALTESRTA